MAINQPIFINEFAKGASENSSIGIGTLVGVETYTKKGVASLTKDTVKVSGSVVTDLVTSFAAKDSLTVFGQSTAGKVYKTSDGGTTWTDISPGTTGIGYGIVFYEGYLLAFRSGKVDYLSSPYGAGNWTQNWLTLLVTSGFTSSSPFVFPGDNSVYFGDGILVGRIGLGTAPVFNPGGTRTVDYLATSISSPATVPASLILPDFYSVNCMSFIPPNYVVLGTGSATNPEVADLIRWNPTLSTYESPLRLYSTQGGGVQQLINRNNILYAVTNGNQCMFETNGTTFNQIADFSLRTNVRSVNGGQLTQPIFMYPKPGAITVQGNKILTGISTQTVYSPFGYFPAGVWSVAFVEQGKAIQCEYTISTGTVVAQNAYSIGALFSLPSLVTLIAWQDGTGFGIDAVKIYDYQSDIADVIIESEMLEIGTPLDPGIVQNIQINLTRKLVTGQTITVNARTSFDQDFTLLKTFDPATDGSSTGYKITKNSIGATRFVQLQVRMATSGSSIQLTPEIRNIILE